MLVHVLALKVDGDYWFNVLLAPLTHHAVPSIHGRVIL